MQFVVTNL